VANTRNSPSEKEGKEGEGTREEIRCMQIFDRRERKQKAEPEWIGAEETLRKDSE
jgi:hypothetical protein